MKNNERKSSKLRGSLSGSLLTMTVVPLLALGLIITIIGSKRFSNAMSKEVRYELQNMAVTVLISYDELYEGDYELVDNQNQKVFAKGNQILSDHNELLDRYKEKTDIDITFFYKDTRVLTTIRGNEDSRIVGTGAHPNIIKEVIEKQNDAFYDNVDINGRAYFAYYKPIFDQKGVLFGIIGVAKPAETVKRTVWTALWPIIIAAIVSMIIAGAISIRYASSLLNLLFKMGSFLDQVAKGNLTVDLSSEVLSRGDEIGQMGRSATQMERSLRELVEKDALTSLYNRRFGDSSLKKLWQRAEKTGIHYAIAIGDIDFFKKVNDTYGHECGDLVLKGVADILKRHMVGRGTVVRWGGEEFLFLFTGVDSQMAARSLEEILEEIREMEIVYDHQTVRVTMTFGVVDGDCEQTVDKIVEAADDKLYLGKQNGRDRVIL